MTKKKKSPQTTCPVCGVGELKFIAREGRVFEYKGFEYPIPAAMELVECMHCHDMPMTPSEVEAVEGPIAERHRQRMADLLDGSLREIERSVPIGDLERMLHLSQGYLARARSKAEPSFPLAALLKLLAKDPKNLRTLSEFARGTVDVVS